MAVRGFRLVCVTEIFLMEEEHGKKAKDDDV
jgi:hypothetical protein